MGPGDAIAPGDTIERGQCRRKGWRQ